MEQGFGDLNRLDPSSGRVYRYALFGEDGHSDLLEAVNQFFG